jgi:uncharacterized protein YyaL (SSP411 family)
MASMLFAGLGAICNEQRYREAARACVQTYGAQLQQFGPGYCMLLCAWDMITAESSEIALNGDASEQPFSALVAEYTGAFNPSAVFVHRPTDHLGRELLSGAGYPWEQAPQDSVLVCKAYTCELPRTVNRQ